MNRRGFLQAMLAASVAPAVVKAENIMKIWVPPEPEIIKPVMTIYDDGAEDFTVESWVQPATLGTWFHVALVRNDGNIDKYLNGKKVKQLPDGLDIAVAPTSKKLLDVEPFDGWMQDLRVVKEARIPTSDRTWVDIDPKDYRIAYSQHMEKGLSVFKRGE